MAKLNIVGTPLGNLEDISLRALRILKESDLIFTEDKRVTIKLLEALEIGKKELFTFNEASAERIVDKAFSELLKHENCALVTDAGMPIVSDPGYQLVEKCHKNNVEIDVIPGPSAPITALAASGFPGSKFLFLGFLPRNKNLRRMLRNIKELPYVIVFFESPMRVIETMNEILQIMGNREIFIAREMTKVYQEFYRGNITDAIDFFKSKDSVKGEFTVVLSGRNEEQEKEDEEI